MTYLPINWHHEASPSYYYGKYTLILANHLTPHLLFLPQACIPKGPSPDDPERH